ncbi:MAG: sugar ABC transporter permease, partial [Bifidobacterium sp.]|nr:sugar ABC transporter permease [Bifidobacterium sp.]
MSRVDSSAVRPKASALGRPGGSQAGGQGGKGTHWTTTLAPYLFVFPAFAIVFIFVIVAALNTCRLAFTDSTLLRPGKFVGIENFVKIVHDDYFWTALLNSTLYVVCVVPFMVILPLILANL